MELQTTWTWLPAIYLFLGGLGAGAFCAVSVIRLAFPGKCKATVTFGVWLAVISLVVGLFALVAELEKPLQGLILFQSFVNLSSWMAIGAWLLFCAVIIFVLSALFTTEKSAVWIGQVIKPLAKHRDRINKALAIIGIPFALAVAIYTGILLGAAPSIPLWSTWLLPALFTVSALDTGVAAISIYSVLFEKDKSAESLRPLFERVIAVLIVIEVIVLTVFLTTMLGGTQSQMLSAQLITEGPLSVFFWVLVVAVGLVIPLITAVVQIVLSRKRKKEAGKSVALPVGGAAGALIGGFTLRYIVLSAGIHAVLISPVFTQAMSGTILFIP